jgi:endonuclease/exonuclease/phosphatase family metal-dependent hydrolase
VPALRVVADSFRVLTLNIWNLAGDWRARRQAIVAVVRRWEPDVVCLQEVVANDRGNQAEWLADALGEWSVAYAGEPIAGGPDLFGNAVLSRRPIDATTTGRLPHVPDDAEVQRVVLHARTGGVDVFSTHLAWQLHDAALRERQVQALVGFVEERTDPASPLGPVIAGDFNAEPDAAAIRYLSGLAALDGASTYFQDAWRLAGDGGPGLTWANVNPHAALDGEPDRRLDYVFSGFRGPGGAGRPVDCRVVADEPVEGVWPSDHYGVLAVLQR